MSEQNYQDDSFPQDPGDLCDFAQASIKSKLLSVEDVANALAEMDANRRQQDREVARHFIRTNVLTKWQAQLLLGGKTRGFFLGRYKLLKQLGEGGQGVVYLAEHTLMKRVEAVKYFSWQPRQGPSNLGRLAREVTLSAMLKHPNIVSISFADTDRRGLYMAMEYVEGVNWGELPKRNGPLPFDEATRLLYDAAGALHYAHTHPSSIIHRDIKPHNLMLTNDGQVRVLDLGLAKALTDNDDSHSYRTQTGTLLGTPSYMAPEQFEGTGNLDARVDIYSLGLTFFYLLTGKAAIDPAPPLIMGDRHRKGQLKPIERFRDDIPPALLSLYQKMTAVDPNARFDSCEAVQTAIKAWQNKGLETVPSQTVRRPNMNPVEPASHAPADNSQRQLVLDEESGLTMTLVRVPSGRFWAGASTEMIDIVSQNSSQSLSQKAREFLASNRHREVDLDEFWMSQGTVTNEMFSCFLEATGDAPPRGWTTLTSSTRKHPVVAVTLKQARAFCQWAKVRLPSIEEWEKGARSDDGRIYPWGNDFDAARCNGKEAGVNSVVDVDLLADWDSPYGIRQATGNVWEWVETGESRAQLRGGSFDTHCQYYGTVFTPMRAVANLVDNDVGFRIVIDDPKSHQPPQRSAVKAKPLSPNEFPRATPPGSASHEKVNRCSTAQAVRNEILATMVDIPASTFTRGISAAQAQDMLQAWGLPQSNLSTLVGDGTKRVSLPAFSIARFCVTNQQYREFVRSTGHAFPEVWQSGYVDETSTPPSNWGRLPVTHVNHHDCQAFCDWVGLKLPSEEQWEFAARGVDGRLYPWGDKFDVALCNCGESGKGQPMPVDWCPDGVSPFDLFNCSGNVMEWCANTKEQLAIARGGSFATSGPVYGLASFTLWVGRDLRQPFTGMRLVID